MRSGWTKIPKDLHTRQIYSVPKEVIRQQEKPSQHQLRRKNLPLSQAGNMVFHNPVLQEVGHFCGSAASTGPGSPRVCSPTLRLACALRQDAPPTVLRQRPLLASDADHNILRGAPLRGQMFSPKQVSVSPWPELITCLCLYVFILFQFLKT